MAKLVENQPCVETQGARPWNDAVAPCAWLCRHGRQTPAPRIQHARTWLAASPDNLWRDVARESHSPWAASGVEGARRVLPAETGGGG